MNEINIDELAQWIVDCWEYYHSKPQIHINGKCYDVVYGATYVFL
jgi:hypothetical protein